MKNELAKVCKENRPNEKNDRNNRVLVYKTQKTWMKRH